MYPLASKLVSGKCRNLSSFLGFPGCPAIRAIRNPPQLPGLPDHPINSSPAAFIRATLFPNLGARLT